MKNQTESAEELLLQAALEGESGWNDHQPDLMLEHARAQKNSEAEANWRQFALYIVLFIFLYAVLGASLTLDLSTSDSAHKSIDYALEAVPVLIAFSGYFVSVLFLFFCRSCARRQANWRIILLALEKHRTPPLFRMVETLGTSSTNYSVAATNTALALFICVTWIVMYNFLTFTTSGVIGSVISLFITTMTYVILDIQLLKSSQFQSEAPQE